MRARLIWNPRAGGGLWAHHGRPSVVALQQAGWQVEVAATRAAGDATQLAESAVAAGYDVVLAAGGDGTLNEVMQPLVHTPVALGVLPCGSANLFARELGLPLRAERAAGRLANGMLRDYDVGQISTGRYFLLWAGIGLDAAAVRGVPAGLKKWLGLPGVGLSTAWTMVRYETEWVDLELDHQRLERDLLLMVVANTRLYALQELIPTAKPDDGQFDLCLFRGRGLADKFGHFARWVAGRHLSSVQVEQYRSATVAVRSRAPLPVQVDGEYIGTTPLAIDLVPRALRVLVPAPAEASDAPRRAE